MSELEFGPVELFLVGYQGDRPDPGVVESIRELVDSGQVRVIDAVIVSRSEDDVITEIEIDNTADLGLGETDLDLAGLAADEDVEALAEALEPGTSAAVLVVELLWAKKFVSRLTASGGAVLASERIPALVVNELVKELREA